MKAYLKKILQISTCLLLILSIQPAEAGKPKIDLERHKINVYNGKLKKIGKQVKEAKKKNDRESVKKLRIKRDSYREHLNVHYAERDRLKNEQNANKSRRIGDTVGVVSIVTGVLSIFK